MILDILGNMAVEPLDLIKESLKYLVKLMSDKDNIAFGYIFK